VSALPITALGQVHRLEETADQLVFVAHGRGVSPLGDALVNCAGS
jgi:hypothetical protein